MAATFTASEKIEERAGALLTEGAVRVTELSGLRVVAAVKGREGAYTVRRDGTSGSWTCDCPNYYTCSHLVAVWKVTVSDV